MNRIKDLRLASGMSQAQLGQRLGCHGTTVSKFELETRQLDPALICTLCDIFGCTADYLLGRSGVERFDLSEEEIALLSAWRCADDDAQTMVRLALKRWIPADNEKEAAV